MVSTESVDDAGDADLKLSDSSGIVSRSVVGYGPMDGGPASASREVLEDSTGRAPDAIGSSGK